MSDPRQPTTEAILQALRTVQDPDLDRDIVTLGFVKNMIVKDGAVSFTIDLTTPACPVKDLLKKQAEEAVRRLPGVKSVAIEMTATVRGGAATGTANALPAVRNIIAVAAGKGGVGKSTVAANLAAGLARAGARVGCLDADIYGPSIPLMFGATDRPNIQESPDGRKLIMPIVAHGVKLMSMGFLLDPGKPVIWRGPMLHGALKQFFGDVGWGELDYLIVDLPPGTGDVALTMVQTVPLTGAVLVATPQNVALIDVKKALAMFQTTGVHLLGVVENMTGPIFGQGGAKSWAEEIGARFLGEIPLQAQVRVGGDSGRPAVLDADPEVSGPFQRLCEQVASAVSIRNAEAPAQKPISISR
jgi:ATP-binding protein involved in chromosome partitioning